jgi:GST-like protein
MIDIYFWRTPNSSKITVFCEEASVPYRIVPINIGNGDQLTPEFRAINPNAKVPAIVDPYGPDGRPLTLFESGAILIYLADKFGKFLPRDGAKRYETLQWLMFQMGGMGPMLGQTHHFLIYAPEKIDYAVRRYTKETARLYGVLDQALSKSEFVAGDYSIADMAILPWVVPYKRQGQDLADFPNVRRWFDALRSRPAVAKGLDVGKDLHQADVTKIDERTREVLFGASQFKK